MLHLIRWHRERNYKITFPAMRTCTENGKCDCQSKKKQSVVIMIRKIKLKFDCPSKLVILKY